MSLSLSGGVEVNALEKHYTVEQVAEAWGVSTKTIRRHSQIGNLTEHEEEICRAVPDFWSDPAARAEDPGGMRAAVLNSIIKRYGPKGS